LTGLLANPNNSRLAKKDENSYQNELAEYAFSFAKIMTEFAFLEEEC
jgi:hypothetical protein